LTDKKQLKTAKMKTLINTAFFLFSLMLSAQENDIWYLFDDEKTELWGYKDSEGNIKIEPKFFMVGDAEFKNINPVVEEASGEWEHYFLLKNGKKVGIDSLYWFDNAPDCEREGFIRFETRQKMGLFNQQGKAVISAEYDHLTQVRNGLLIGLKEAQRKCWGEDEEYPHCEHWGWDGGKSFLIDTLNHVLVEDFTWKKAEYLDFYSLQISDVPNADTIRVNFRGVNGKYYSFIHNEKAFKQFLKTELLNNLSVENLIAHSYPNIIYKYKSQPSSKIIKKNYKHLSEKLASLLKKDTDYYICEEDYFFPPENSKKEWKQYYNYCSQWNIEKYPIMLIVLNYKARGTSQDHYYFLKTNQGFQLIEVDITNKITHIAGSKNTLFTP
jgi:hypothetical protein